MRTWLAVPQMMRSTPTPLSRLIQSPPRGMVFSTNSLIGIYIADCAILWRTIARKTPYCRATAPSFAPPAPTETNHAQVAKSRPRAMNKMASPSAASKAAQAKPAATIVGSGTFRTTIFRQIAEHPAAPQHHRGDRKVNNGRLYHDEAGALRQHRRAAEDDDEPRLIHCIGSIRRRVNLRRASCTRPAVT